MGKNAKQQLSLQEIILKAHDEIKMFIQWNKIGSSNLRANHANNFELLVRLAEVMVCGSYGGFDVVETKDGLLAQRWITEYEALVGPKPKPIRNMFKKYLGLVDGKYDHGFLRWLWLFTFYVDEKTKSTIDVEELKKYFRLKQCGDAAIDFARSVKRR